METLGKVPYIASFIAGLLTFVSPCVLPIIPAYISFIAGASIDELKNNAKSAKKTFFTALFFVLGFSAVFVILGASATLLGNFLGKNKDIIRWVGGIIVIIFGLHLSGLFTIPFLNYQKKIQLGNLKISYLGAFLIGITFAAGWTPCIGPILSSILILASTQGKMFQGIMLLLFYSLGIGIPLLITALFINWALSVFAAIKKYYRIIEILSGVILVVIGIIILTGNFNRLTGYIVGLFG